MYGVKLIDITYDTIDMLKNTFCTSTDQTYENMSVWYGRTPDGKVWKCVEVYDLYNTCLVQASVEYLYTCEAHPYCSECAGYCSRAIPSEDGFMNWRVF